MALAALYSKEELDAQKAIQDRTGALFFMVVNQAFGMLGPVLTSFDTERQVVTRVAIAICVYAYVYEYINLLLGVERRQRHGKDRYIAPPFVCTIYACM